MQEKYRGFMNAKEYLKQSNQPPHLIPENEVITYIAQKPHDYFLHPQHYMQKGAGNSS
jgi:hypothetical protein